MFGLGIGEIAVILVIALVFIGPKKLPELARTLGKGFREFQGAMKGLNSTLHDTTTPTEFKRAEITPEAKPEVKPTVPWEEQFKDDPPHDQNLAAEDLALQKDIASQEKESK